MVVVFLLKPSACSRTALHEVQVYQTLVSWGQLGVQPLDWQNVSRLHLWKMAPGLSCLGCFLLPVSLMFPRSAPRRIRRNETDWLSRTNVRLPFLEFRGDGLMDLWISSGLRPRH